MKKLTASILASALVISVMGINAFAAESIYFMQHNSAFNKHFRIL